MLTLIQFLSTLSLRRATTCVLIIRKQCRHFYPRSPCGERPPSTLRHCTTYLFLSTLSLRRATGHGHTGHGGVPFLSTLSLRRATRASSALSLCSVNFYPRSPCGERPDSGIGAWRYRYFYPRSPCGERPCCPASSSTRQVFLSTLSLRRATPHVRRLPPHRAISIHALLAESDPGHPAPCRSAPSISIHALLAESDELLQAAAAHPVDFYPRSPCGERRVHYDNYNLHCVISIHALLAESDNARHGPAAFAAISIHALLAESDQSQTLVLLAQQLFLSTLSLRRATC